MVAGKNTPDNLNTGNALLKMKLKKEKEKKEKYQE